MRSHYALYACLHSLALLIALLGCGGDDNAVAIDDIAQDKKLVDLSSDEQKGVCSWAQSYSRDKLPMPGTMINCNGQPLTFNGASQCNAVPANCSATVAQWRTCVTAFVGAIAADPCLVWQLSFSLQDATEYVDSLHGCEGLGPCATVMR